MASVELLPSRRLIMVDDRGDALRATWHPDQGSVVVSHWKSDTCCATYQLDLAATTRLTQYLVGVLAASTASATEHAVPARPPGPFERLRHRIRGRWAHE